MKAKHNEEKFGTKRNTITPLAQPYNILVKKGQTKLNKAQNGIIGNISENWSQKWTAGPVNL